MPNCKLREITSPWTFLFALFPDRLGVQLLGDHLKYRSKCIRVAQKSMGGEMLAIISCDTSMSKNVSDLNVLF